ncbi:hypothetical protein B0H16DRAFT_1696406 [Mycena metata]|uniref:Uncharacterized protein n=1 Tax=Mycena metata TaxID=1033252 RepID=A0AAD7I0V2_9AGAR|nr:hypothetical protein B0H16DRAFT_1696406 [Mycena metata]
MHRHQPKTNDIPPHQRLLLKLQKLLLAPRQYTPRITRRADRRFYERAKVPTAPQYGLDGEAAGGAELLELLLVDLGLEVEGAALVGYVPRDDEQGKGSVDREEGAVVQHKGGGECAEGPGELGGDGDEEDVRVLEGVEVREEGECEGEGVAAIRALGRASSFMHHGGRKQA